MKKYLILTLLSLMLCPAAQAQAMPKREFRGAWIHVVNGDIAGLGTEATQQKLTRYLDALQRINTNVIMFQVRPEADALYVSQHEPWSRWLTGVQGQAPSPYWDPLQWMIDQCHSRGMELHAWINPYRAKTAGTRTLAANHPYNQHPERFFEYRGQYIFNPGLAENREHICKVVRDIITHYDVDGIHMDDYFYPYPAAGLPIPDDETFRQYGAGYSNVADWRRDNVSLLIQQLHDSIRSIKPWVKFGISPFGIYHNHRDGDPIPGSRTNGNQNYDALYADVLKWVNNGWVDYNVPQLYWNIGFKIADYSELVRWWAQYTSNRPLVIGQSLTNTMKGIDLNDPTQCQLPAKWDLQRRTPGVAGSCLWYGAQIADNHGGSADYLAQTYHRYPALQPLMPFIDNKAPTAVRGLKSLWTPDGLMLIWLPRETTDEMQRQHSYVVYRFAPGEKRDTSDPSKIVAITRSTFIQLPYKDGKTKYQYVVTALDRMHNESKAKSKKVKL